MDRSPDAGSWLRMYPATQAVVVSAESRQPGPPDRVTYCLSMLPNFGSLSFRTVVAVVCPRHHYFYLLVINVYLTTLSKTQKQSAIPYIHSVRNLCKELSPMYKTVIVANRLRH